MLLLKHYRYIHTGPDCYITCGIDGCYKTYTNVRSYRVHVRSKHEEVQRHIDHPAVEPVEDEPELEVPEQDEPQADPRPDPSETSSFLLYQQEKYLATGKTCTFVCDEIADLMEQCRQDISSKVNDALEKME